MDELKTSSNCIIGFNAQTQTFLVLCYIYSTYRRPLCVHLLVE